MQADTPPQSVIKHITQFTGDLHKVNNRSDVERVSENIELIPRQNIAHSRRPDSIATMIRLLIVFYRLLFRYVLRVKPLSPEQREVLASDFETRLILPQFGELKQRFGVVPADLRALYQNHDLLIRKNLTLVAEAGLTEDYIRSFLPADSVTLKEHKLKAKNCFPFAVCGPESYFAAVISPGNDQECAVALIYAGER